MTHIVHGLHDYSIALASRLSLAAALLLIGAVPFNSLATAATFSQSERKTYQSSIVDKQNQLNRNFKKVRRQKTKYIIVHTSEGGLTSTLRSVSKGKSHRGKWLSRGGHANYVIARNGRTYRILDGKFRADHAGMSLWNGEKDISSVSIGIELVGYHYSTITDQQYRSLGLLIDILQDSYNLDDMAVLTHSQVAFGNPNRWIKKSHRGRKRCAQNFDRGKAGLTAGWTFDPDVVAGRLSADPLLASLLYDRMPATAKTVGSNVITSTNHAWTIAGDEYNSPTTLYQLPNGKNIPGDQIEKEVGWNRIPKNTKVLLHQEQTQFAKSNEGIVKRISDGATAWDFAGLDYNKKSTIYFFPGGGVKNGNEISDWDELPPQTRMIVGYRGPYEVTGQRPPSVIAGPQYNQDDTLYYFPDNQLLTGSSVKDFSRLPKGVLLFIPENG
ncbi:MAG: peptidoglycan recognition family protein [Candidatus Latescibacterota bacterium]